MRGFAAVFGREVSEWWRSLAIASLALGTLAAVLPLFMARPGFSVSDFRSAMSLLFALLLCAALAVLLGGSVVSSDLAEKRLGFYFARPLPGGALWTGKIAAAMTLVLGGGFLVLVPSLLLGEGPDLRGGWEVVAPLKIGGLGWALLFSVFLLYLLLAAHAVSVILRSRSPWIGLDVAALGGILALFGMARERLLLAGVAGTSPVLPTDLGLVLLIGPVLFVAGAVQVLKGRTDIRRAHRFLSGALWGLLLVLMLLFDASSRWIVNASPGDLVAAYQTTAPREGSWIAVAGPARNRPGYMPGFLYDVPSGRFERARIGIGSLWGGPPLPVGFSGDGRRAVWLEFDGPPFRSPLVAWYLDLDQPESRPVRTNVLFDRSSQPESLAVSPDGRRVAAVHQGRIVVSEVETGRLVASVPSPREVPFSRLSFLDSDRVRIYGSPLTRDPASSPFFLYEMNVPAGRLERTGIVPGGVRSWNLSPEGGRAILRGRDTLQVRDSRTGELLADLGGSGRRFASFLKDGRVALTRSTPEGMELLLLAPDGRSELLRFGFPGSRRLALADQPAPDRLRVVTARTLESSRDWEVRLLDLETGKVRSVVQRALTLLDPQGRTTFDFKNRSGVVWFDWMAGQERAILRDP